MVEVALDVEDTDLSAVGAADEFDSPAEVDAAFTTQRRLAFGYFAVFLVVTFAAPLLSLTLDWWSQARIVGGMSPNFVVAAVGLYLFFFALGLRAAKVAEAVEDRMLGAGEDLGDEDDAGDGPQGALRRTWLVRPAWPPGGTRRSGRARARRTRRL